MNLQEMAKKYPEAYDLFVDYGSIKLMTMREKAKSMLQTWNDNIPLNGVTEKLLVEFFDEQGVILTIYFDPIRDIYYWRFIQKGYTWIEDGKEFSSRQQAFESGIEKAFEIIESKLEGEK